jgi:hypothetical protein
MDRSVAARRLRIVGTSALWALSLLAAPPTAVAQSATAGAADIATARALAIEGLELADADKCEAAIDKLARAEAVYHAPTTLGRIGECQIALGKLVAGTEALRRVVNEPLAPRASRAFHAARKRAATVLEAALPRLPTLIVQVSAPPGRTARVAVDGEQIPAAALGFPRPADPGERVVTASADGCRDATVAVTLKEGRRETVRIALEEAAEAPAPSAAPVAVTASPRPPDALPLPWPAASSAAPAQARGSRDHTAAWALGGVGAAGLAVGAVYGILAIRRKSALDEQCEVKRCPIAARPDIDALETYTTVSTVGFAFGAAGSAAALTLLLWPSGDEPHRDVRAPVRARAGVRPFAAAGAVGVAGAF